MSAETLRVFELLLSSIPNWIADLKATAKANEASQNAQKRDSEQVELLSGEEKTDVRSEITGSDLSLETPALCTQEPATRAHFQLRLKTSFEKLRPRKRKAPSVTQDTADAQQKRRSIEKPAKPEIYYDGDEQKRFESMVKDIGASRNTLRKTKLGAIIENLECSYPDSDEDGFSGDELAPPSKAPDPKQSARTNSSTAFGKRTGTKVFDEVDKHLNEAQCLVEKAAYQALREGRYQTELSSAQDQFQCAVSLVQAEVDRLNAKAARRPISRARTPEPALQDPPMMSKLYPMPPNRPVLAVAGLRLDVDLEVDDNVSSDDETFSPANIRSMLPPRSQSSYRRYQAAPPTRQVAGIT